MEFENYDVTSKNYISKRVAIGINIIKEELGPDSKNKVLLDAGCGTGNYTFQLADSVKEVYCFDFNQGMLA